jgi:hypothetical protein
MFVGLALIDILFPVALKFGVGVALVVVAHIVLVKKWKSWGLYNKIFLLSKTV